MPRYEGIKCPNHAEMLEDVTLTDGVGRGRCPISGCMFDIRADMASRRTVKTKDGHIITEINYQITGNEV